MLKAVIWRTQAARLALPRNGDQVIAHGSISVYEAGGQYQLYVDHLEPAGVGRLWLEFERLKARLAAEGLFDEARKRPIPARPAAAGCGDLGHGGRAARYSAHDRGPLSAGRRARWRRRRCRARKRRRASWPQSKPSTAGLAETEPLDVIILARGGGSLEDLWAFNDERVARAIAASAVPVITGVGHETDFTIADFAADLRAPTPTGAATLATPDRRELAAAVRGLAASAQIQIHPLAWPKPRSGADALAHRLGRQSPVLQIARDRQARG